MWQDMFDLLVANAVQNGIIENDISATGAVNRGGCALTMRPSRADCGSADVAPAATPDSPAGAAVGMMRP
jgi:hypothetical protein